MLPTVPPPRRPLHPSDPVRQWYENELAGRRCRFAATTGRRPALRRPGHPLRRRVSEPCDTWDRPLRWPCTQADRHRAGIRRLGTGSGRLGTGSGCGCWWPRETRKNCRGCDWLEWGALALDLTAMGAGGSIEAPLPPGVPEGASEGASEGLITADGAGTGGPGGSGPQGAAVWLRPPKPECEVEPSLPTLSAVGGGGGAPDLVGLVDTVATQCHRVRLRRASAPSRRPTRRPGWATGPWASTQPLAFS